MNYSQESEDVEMVLVSIRRRMNGKSDSNSFVIDLTGSRALVQADWDACDGIRLLSLVLI